MKNPFKRTNPFTAFAVGDEIDHLGVRMGVRRIVPGNALVPAVMVADYRDESGVVRSFTFDEGDAPLLAKAKRQTIPTTAPGQDMQHPPMPAHTRDFVRDVVNSGRLQALGPAAVKAWTGLFLWGLVNPNRRHQIPKPDIAPENFHAAVRQLINAGLVEKTGGKGSSGDPYTYQMTVPRDE